MNYYVKKYNKIVNETNKNNSDSQNIVNVRDRLKSIPQKSDRYEKAEELTQYANELNNISKK